MRVIADLHIHSKYSIATSKYMGIKEIALAAKVKGVNVIGTGDFTHAKWIKELKERLTECRRFRGMLCLKDNRIIDVYFILQTEISTVYKDKGKVRKVHHVILCPGFEIAEQINDVLSRYGDLNKDGRPTLRISSSHLVEEVINVSKQCFIFPAHIWTPWFGILGSKSGYDSLEEAYENKVRYIKAIETGLSSDPEMNWAVSMLDKFTPISNSDAHSPETIGREANVFELERVDYNSIINAITTRSGFIKTIEFYPQHGKYYYDGHRKCRFSVDPKKKLIHCKVCNGKLTFGVLHRVMELSDHRIGRRPKNAIPFSYVIPLKEVISKAIGKGKNTRTVEGYYKKMIAYFGSELNVYESGDMMVDKRISKFIEKIKENKIKWNPGYDGIFGIFQI